ncbi:MAG: glycosyltransferase family 2 protein [Nitrospirae bacterium]|nr:glycosyltransferase family 2 protein [Nitrospirota bacterium]
MEVISNFTEGRNNPDFAIPLLTVAIPTWNRADKLRKLLLAFVEQIEGDQLSGIVEIFVSDNGSTDSTPVVCREFSGQIRSVRHAENAGFDANVWSCYQQAGGQYVLFFSDDDVPEPSLLRTVTRLVTCYQPAVMLYSFLQPPHTADSPTIDINTEFLRTTDAQSALRYLVKFAKLSTYCIRKRIWSKEEICELTAKLGTDYFFISLAVFAFLKEQLRGCLLHRAPLARCSEGYNVGFRFAPTVFANRGRAADIGNFREVAPADLILSLDADPVATSLKYLRDHYMGEFAFAQDALAQGERFIWQHPAQLLTIDRVFLTIDYCTAKYIRKRLFRNWVMNMTPILRRIVGRIRNLSQFRRLSRRARRVEIS